ncbi:MAG TPA: hypothetical protein VNQ53_17140 [Nocardioides sp.]|nr:hypothetical protein [Nocardioides sp.]
MTPRLITSALIAAGLLLAGCSDDEPKRDDDAIVLSPAEPGAGHTHGPGGETVIGDGTRASAGGYSLVDVRLPRFSVQPGDLSFRIVDRQGRPVRDYVEEQTKLLHMYVVRNDLQDFRHLHPVLGKDGTWTARAALAEPGSYRVLAEFTPGKDPEAAHVVLGRNEIVPGSWEPVEPAAEPVADDGVVRVAVDDPIETGPDGRMRITVDDGDGGQVTLGSYLGSYAHVTGFELESGSFVHVHPDGEPEPTDDGSELTFHTEFEKPGSYRFFVQVRVDGFLHTVPVTATVE